MSAVKLHFKVSRFVIWIGALSGITFFLLVALYWSDHLSRGYRSPHYHRLPTPLERPPPVPYIEAPDDANWEFQASRDADNYGLSEQQCKAAFPKLFGEIEKSVASRQLSKITVEDLDSQKWLHGMVRGMVYNGEVLYLSARDILHAEPFTATHHPCRASGRLQVQGTRHATFTSSSPKLLPSTPDSTKHRVHLPGRRFFRRKRSSLDLQQNEWS